MTSKQWLRARQSLVMYLIVTIYTERNEIGQLIRHFVISFKSMIWLYVMHGYYTHLAFVLFSSANHTFKSITSKSLFALNIPVIPAVSKSATPIATIFSFWSVIRLCRNSTFSAAKMMLSQIYLRSGSLKLVATIFTVHYQMCLRNALRFVTTVGAAKGFCNIFARYLKQSIAYGTISEKGRQLSMYCTASARAINRLWVSIVEIFATRWADFRGMIDHSSELTFITHASAVASSAGYFYVSIIPQVAA